MLGEGDCRWVSSFVLISNLRKKFLCIIFVIQFFILLPLIFTFHFTCRFSTNLNFSIRFSTVYILLGLCKSLPLPPSLLLTDLWWHLVSHGDPVLLLSYCKEHWDGTFWPSRRCSFLLFTGLNSTYWLTGRLTRQLTDSLTEWLIMWLTEWLTRWLIDWLVGSLAGWLTDWLTEWMTDYVTDWLTDSLTDWMNECRLTDWPID